VGRHRAWSIEHGVRKQGSSVYRPTGYAATRRTEGSRQYRYPLFGRSVAISCLEDFYGFYDSPFTVYDFNGFNDFYDFYGFYDFNDLTNSLFL
jgi:hypothetical protein